MNLSQYSINNKILRTIDSEEFKERIDINNLNENLPGPPDGSLKGRQNVIPVCSPGVVLK